MKKKELGTKEAKLCCCPYVSIEVLTVVAVNVLECIEPRLGSALKRTVQETSRLALSHLCPFVLVYR